MNAKCDWIVYNNTVSKRIYSTYRCPGNLFLQIHLSFSIFSGPSIQLVTAISEYQQNTSRGKKDQKLCSK